MMRALRLAANAVDTMMELYGPPACGAVEIEVYRYFADGPATYAKINLPCTVAVRP